MRLKDFPGGSDGKASCLHVDVCLLCFHITELNDLGCRRIFCQNQLYKGVMKFLEISLHSLLLTQLENRAMSKGYSYDLSAV